MLPRRNRSCAKSHRSTTHRFRWACAIAVGLVALMGVNICFAQRIVLVRPPATETMPNDAFNRLRAELNLQLFDVVVTDTCVDPPCPGMVELAQSQNGLASVQLKHLEPSIVAELAIIDRTSHQPEMLRLELQSNQDAPAVLALRAVDLLRNRLREVPPPQPPPPPAKPRRIPTQSYKIPDRPPAPRRTSVRIGAAALGVAPAISTAYGLELTLDQRVTERLRLGIDLFGPGMGAKLETANGTATIRHEMFSVRAGLLLLSARHLQIWSSVGLGLYHLEANAETPAEFLAKRGQLYAMLASFTGNGAFRLSNVVSLELDLSAVTLTPQPRIAVADSSTSYRAGLWMVAVGTRINF